MLVFLVVGTHFVFIQFEIFLVLGTVTEFPLKWGHYGYYVMIL